MKIDANRSWIEAHEVMVGAVAPRPIAFVSTVGEDDIFNVAPFSLFTPISMRPIIIGFSIGRREGQKKDTLVNIEFLEEFVVNVVTEDIAEAMNKAAANYPSHVDEFREVGLTPVKADLVKPPMVGESPINMECRLRQILEFGTMPRCNSFVIGEVERIHIKDEVYVNDEIQIAKLKLVGRLGGGLYCRTTDIFEMKRPESLK